MTLLLAVLVLLAPPDTLQLDALHRAALSQDPRLRQIDLHEDIAALRIDNLRTQYFPQVSVSGQGTVQSDVPSVPVERPGLSIPTPPKDRYQVALDVNQMVYDAGVTARRQDVEAAARDVERQSVRVDLYALTEQVNDAFFGALLLQEQGALLAVRARDLQARIEQVTALVDAGAALPGSADALRAERLRVEQQQAEVQARRRALLDVLVILTGRDVAPDDVLALPVQEPVGLTPEVRRRPEYALFDRQRALLQRRSALASVQTRPRLTSFAQVGYGRPGLNFFDDTFQPFGQVGLRVQWPLWDWRMSQRERAALALQQQIVETQEEAFTRRLRIAVQRDRREVERLEAALETDADLIALRERIARQAASQLRNGTLTAAEYVEVSTDVFEARLARERHRIELAQARVRIRTTLGEDL
ncbi:MAG: TolC family protein [Bacteroidetes bacterium]|jgi:outer membrane protein TolC|nr:TolC family protein [Bacteroidota bacterium]